MSFLYHYHAEYRQPSHVYSIDGIASLARPIRNMDDYHDLKSVIVKDLAPAIPADQLIVCSLSPLGETDS